MMKWIFWIWGVLNPPFELCESVIRSLITNEIVLESDITNQISLSSIITEEISFEENICR